MAQLKAAEWTSRVAVQLDSSNKEQLSELQSLIKEELGLDVSTSVLFRRSMQMYLNWLKHMLKTKARADVTEEDALKWIEAERDRIRSAANK